LLQKNDRIWYIVVYCLLTSAVPKRTRFTATQDKKMLDYRFPTALQMVLSVAMAEQLGERSTSAILAYGLEANPSFIRKFMVPLTRDGIIVSTLGRNGSIHLGRPAEEITLRDIYVSVIEDKKLWASRPDVPARCVVSANACWYFKSIADEAEQASLAVLARHTVASALEEVKNADSTLPELIAQYKKRLNFPCCVKNRLHCERGFLLSAAPYAGETSSTVYRASRIYAASRKTPASGTDQTASPPASRRTP
jgi:Rrf2 family transcriptional repressor of oqxAB